MSKANLLPVDWKMITVDAADVPDEFWGTQEEYEEGGNYLGGFVDGAGLKPVLKLDDDWGWDFMYQLKNGRFVMDDRNSGVASYFTKREFNVLAKLAS
jgi:hypothetical protein